MCHGQLVDCSVMWRQRRAEVQTSQSDATRSVEDCSWRFLRRPKTANLQTVGEVYLKCSASPLEASRSIMNSLRSCIKNRFHGPKQRFSLRAPCSLSHKKAVPLLRRSSTPENLFPFLKYAGSLMRTRSQYKKCVFRSSRRTDYTLGPPTLSE